MLSNGVDKRRKMVSKSRGYSPKQGIGSHREKKERGNRRCSGRG